MKYLFIGFVFLAGCAAPRPLVDMKGVDQAKYNEDLKECQQYAEQTYGAGTGAAVGAGVGYALGQVVARTTGARGVANEAGRGMAVVGGASGGAQGLQHKRQVVKRCMTGRGYKVLD